MDGWMRDGWMAARIGAIADPFHTTHPNFQDLEAKLWTLSDLEADVEVARLGFEMMRFSCTHNIKTFHIIYGQQNNVGQLFLRANKQFFSSK